MKRSAWAAMVAVTTLTSGVVLAASVSSTARVLDYNDGQHVLTGATLDRGIEKVKILQGTGYTCVDNPDLFTDPTCRQIAQQWNLGLFQSQSGAYFEKLLSQGALNSCKVAYVRTEVADTTGVYGLISVRPVD